MIDTTTVYLITRLQHEQLVREAAAHRLANEALAHVSLSNTPRLPAWRQSVLAWAPSIIERFRVATRLELPGG